MLTAKLKKISIDFAIFVFSGLAFLASPSLAYAATLSLDPGSGTINKGCNFTLSIQLNTQGSNTDGTDAIIKYDSTRVTPTKINNGTIYPDYPGNFIDTQTSKINVSGLASISQAFNGTGTLATVDFTVLSSAPIGLTQLTFDFDPNDKAKTTDSNVVERSTVVDVLNSVGNGSYTVGTGACSQGISGTSGAGAGTGSKTGSTFGDLSSGSKGGPSGTASGTLDDLTGAGTKPGLFGNTILLTTIGIGLTILGILGLAFL